MVVRHYIYCISPAVKERKQATLLSTYFTSKVLVLGDLPCENSNSSFPFPKSFTFPFYPGKKSPVIQKWICSVFHCKPCEAGTYFSQHRVQDTGITPRKLDSFGAKQCFA